MRLPLQDVTVVSVEQAVAAPFATRQLADLGARVIKIERPDGGDFARSYDTTVKGLSSYFVWLNRAKESLTLDLKRAEARTILDRLLQRADVFVQNLAPGAADRLGASADSLRLAVSAADRLQRLRLRHLGSLRTTESLRPAGSGRSGADVDHRHRGRAEQGRHLGRRHRRRDVRLLRRPDRALLARTRSGDGTIVDVSLFDALSEWMGFAAYYTAYGGTPPARTGANHASIAPYGPFESGDGHRIFLGIQNAREWTRFCAEVLRQPQLADDERFRTNPLRVANREALHETIAAVVRRARRRPAIAERLDAAGIANARMNSVAEFLEHPQLAERDCWRNVDSPAGTLRALKPPVRMTGVEPVMGAIPAFGAHTDSILTELGFDEAEIATWRNGGVGDRSRGPLARDAGPFAERTLNRNDRTPS